MSTRETYYRDWYNQNKDKVSERRRKRYREDSDYREKVLGRGRESRRQKRTEKSEPKPKQPVTMWHHGAQYVSIHELAKRLGRYILTVRLWFRKGLVPESPYVSVHGPQQRQWFSDAMVEAIRVNVGGDEVKAMTRKELSEAGERIWKAWVAMGVPVGERVVIGSK